MPRVVLLAVVCLLLLPVALFAGCGSTVKQPAALAPSQAFFYGEVDLSPSGGQKAAIDALARKFPGPGDAGQRLSRLLEDVILHGDAKISLQRDVRPWLGDKAAFFAGGPRGGERSSTPVAALVATEDEDKALATVQKKKGQGSEAEYEGVTYRRFGDQDRVATTLDGYLVVANEPGLKALVDASKNGDRSLESSDRFKAALEGQPADRLGFAYVNARAAFDAIPALQAPFVAPLRGAFREPLVLTASARSDAVEVTSTIPRSQLSVLGVTGLGSQGRGLIGKLPSDSLFATGGPDLGRQLGAGVDLAASGFGGRAILEQALRQRTGLDLQRDVLRWMGDYGIFVRGRDRRSLGGALVVDTKDPKATRRAIPGLRQIVRSLAPGDVRVSRLAVRGADAGFTLTAEGRAPISVFLDGDRFVVAYGNEAARRAIRPRGRLEDAPAFSQATGSLGGDYTATIYASVPTALLLAEGLGAARSAGYQQAKPYLTVMEALVGGSKPAGDGKLELKFRLTAPG